MQTKDTTRTHPCGWCVNGFHDKCRGEIPRPEGKVSHCACANRLHREEQK